MPILYADALEEDMTRARRDNYHDEIRDGLRKCGYVTFDTANLKHGFPDLLSVSKTGVVVLLEVKSENGKLTADEEHFFAVYNSHCHIVHDLDEALREMQFYDEREDE